MTPQKASEVDAISFQDLKILAAAKGPCISILLPLPEPLEIRARLKNVIRSIEKALNGDNPHLLEPIQALAEDIGAEGRWGAGLAVFRSPDLFRQFWVRESSRELVTVGERFQIRPFLGLLCNDKRFYILALNQKEIRLLHCADGQSREVTLPNSVPKSLHDATQTSPPDHVLDNRSIGGPSTGSMKGVVFGTNSDRDAKGEYLHQFFKSVDRGLQAVLKNETAPMVLAGVETEVALYRRVNTYPHLLDKAHLGAPGGLKASELHARAQEIVRERVTEPLQKALALLDKVRDSNHASFKLVDVMKAAGEGRVAHLFLREEAEHRGPDGEDLLNQAALETLVHGGQVFVLHADKMPDKAPAVAALRY